MEISIEQRVHMTLGAQLIEIMALRMENEKLKVQVAALTPPEPEPEPAKPD